MSLSKKVGPSRKHGVILLDRPFQGDEHVGPFVQTGEHMPSLYSQGLYLRVEIKGVMNVLYAWDDGWERWDVVAETVLNIRLSAMEDLLYVFLIQRDLDES